MTMTADKWNGLKVGDEIVKRYDKSRWEVVGIEACKSTHHGSTQVLRLKRISEQNVVSRDFLWYEMSG